MVREENWSSEFTDKSINSELGSKYGKVHGGDPRKNDRGILPYPGRKEDMVVEKVNGKWMKRISGASSIRMTLLLQGKI